DLVPVLPGDVADAVADQVDDAGLHDRAGPDGGDRVGQALEPVADEHQDVLNAAVLQLGEYLEPVLGALSAVSRPYAQDVAVPIDGHGHREIDGAIGDLAI